YTCLQARQHLGFLPICWPLPVPWIPRYVHVSLQSQAQETLYAAHLWRDVVLPFLHRNVFRESAGNTLDIHHSVCVCKNRDDAWKLDATFLHRQGRSGE